MVDVKKNPINHNVKLNNNVKIVGEKEQYLTDALEAERILLSLVKDEHFWNKEDGDVKSGITVFSGVYKTIMKEEGHKASIKANKIWKCGGQINASAEDVLTLLTDASNMASWNQQVDQFRIVDTIDNDTDIVLCLCNSKQTGTVITPRDFLNVRRKIKLKNAYIVSSTGILHKLIPEAPNVVRGWNGPGGFVIVPIAPPQISTPSTSCFLYWFLNSDLRGWLPKKIVDSTIEGVLIDWIKTVRTTLAKKKL